jgi:hypothetical protein
MVRKVKIFYFIHRSWTGTEHGCQHKNDQDNGFSIVTRIRTYYLLVCLSVRIETMSAFFSDIRKNCCHHSNIELKTMTNS